MYSTTWLQRSEVSQVIFHIIQVIFAKVEFYYKFIFLNSLC